MSAQEITAQVRETYDTVAEDYAAYFPGTEPEAAIDLAMIEHFVRLLPGKGPDVLDAGCGTGRMGRYLTDLGCRVRGVDLSPGMIAMAHRNHPDISTQVASITALPFEDRSFNGLFYWYSIIHLPDSDLPTVFDQARRVLRPSGVMLIAFQAGSGEEEVAAKYRERGHDVTLLRFHRTADQLAPLLQSTGFDEVARLVRRPAGAERHDQAVLIARASSD